MSNVPQPQDDKLASWNGRLFAKFALDNNISCVPVDEPEEQNFDEAHGLVNNLFGGIVIPPQFSLNDLDEPAVLDCGHGKGQWIDAVMDHTSGDAWCVGIDIYTGKGTGDDDSEEEDNEDEEVPTFVKKRWNLNASFRACHDPDLRPETFDLINSRLLTDGINADRWPNYVKELKMLLKPGGWLQMVEAYALFQSDNGSPIPFLERWWQYYQHTMVIMGKNPRIGPHLGNLMRDAGFERIQTSVNKMPIGRWMSNQKELGELARPTVIKMLRSVTLWPFMVKANPRLQPAAYEGLIQGAQQELARDDLKIYLNIHYAYGRRPRPRKR